MRAVVVAAVLAVLGLNATIPYALAAKAEGSGSVPATAFDPTGSHPLPNEGVEGRPPGVLPPPGAAGAEEGDGRAGSLDAVAVMVAAAAILVRRVLRAGPSDRSGPAQVRRRARAAR